MPHAHPALVRLPERTMHHMRALPLRSGTRGFPLALTQTRLFLSRLARFCPTLAAGVVQDRRLLKVGGKGLFSGEIHEALFDRRIDFAVHRLRDLETKLPPGIALTRTLRREDARDVLVLGPRCRDVVDSPLDARPRHAVIGASLRADLPRDIFA